MRKDGGYKNRWKEDEVDERVVSVWTEKKFGIGQRAILLRTPNGNVLWDCITYLDQETADKVRMLSASLLTLPLRGSRSSLTADSMPSSSLIRTTSALWSSTFQCPLYLAYADRGWLFRPRLNEPTAKSSTSPQLDKLDLHLLTETYTQIVPGVTAAICGGHFEGSMCLHWEDKLFIADTLLTVPISSKKAWSGLVWSSLLTTTSFPFLTQIIPSQRRNQTTSQ
ncbi:MAG: hypothetical protein Q9160_004540 [Pyrenula sp. 1 TL-2023]